MATSSTPDTTPSKGYQLLLNGELFSDFAVKADMISVAKALLKSNPDATLEAVNTETGDRATFEPKARGAAKPNGHAVNTMGEDLVGQDGDLDKAVNEHLAGLFGDDEGRGGLEDDQDFGDQHRGDAGDTELRKLRELRDSLIAQGVDTDGIDRKIEERRAALAAERAQAGAMTPERVQKAKDAAAEIMARSDAVDAGSTAFGEPGATNAGSTPFGSAAVSELLPPKGKHNGEISRSSAKISTNDYEEPRLWATITVDLDCGKTVSQTYLVGAPERDLAEQEWAGRRLSEDRATFDILLARARLKPTTYDDLIAKMPEMIGMKVGAIVEVNKSRGVANIRTLRAPFIPEELPQR